MRRLLLVVLLVATACGNEGDLGAADGAGDGGGDEVLSGRTFLSQSVAGRELVAGTEIRLTFNDDGTIGASAGCNQLVGNLAFDGDRLVVTNLGGTEMGCDEERHAQDAWLTSFLASGPTWDAADGNGGMLTLTVGEVTISLLDRQVAEPDRPLIGTRWVVDTILEADAASSVPQGVEAWVTLTEARLEGHDGCNGFGADITLDDPKGSLRVGERIQTLIGCRDEVMRLAAAVGAATNGTVAYRIEARRLTLTGAGGKGISAVASD